MARIVNKPLLDEFRAQTRCEWCGRTVAQCEPHHIFCRGMGGGARLDIRENLVALCGPFAGNCHGLAPRHRQYMLRLAAMREGTTPEAIVAKIWRLRRTPKEAMP